jgi:hypothetical protein
MITERKALGVATLRFFPKSKGLRPIINLSKQQPLDGRPVSIVHFFVIRSKVTGQLAFVFTQSNLIRTRYTTIHS